MAVASDPTIIGRHHMPADRTPPASTDHGPGPTSPQRTAAIARLVGLAIAVGVVAFVVVDAGLDLDAVREFVADSGRIAPVLFVLTYATLTVALVPGAILTTTGGLLFGIAAGSILTIIGATLGATTAFLIARATGRDAVDRLASGRVATVDQWVGQRGFLAVFSMRIVPLIPFNVSNYAAGVTAIRLRDFVLGTSLGIIPGVVVYTILGARADDPASPVFLGAVAALVVLAIAGGLWVRRWRSGDGTTAPDPSTTDPDTTPTDAVEM